MTQKNIKRDNYISTNALIKLYQRLYDNQKIKDKGAAHGRLQTLRRKEYESKGKKLANVMV